MAKEETISDEKLKDLVTEQVKELVAAMPYQLVVVGERRLRVLECASSDEIAGKLQEYRDNPEITDVLVFRGQQVEATVVHSTGVTLAIGDDVVGTGVAKKEENLIE